MLIAAAMITPAAALWLGLLARRPKTAAIPDIQK
jgi:hypothetical protein